MRIYHHPAPGDEESAYERISDTKIWLNWKWDLDNPDESEDNSEADEALDVELETGIHNPACPEQRGVSAAPTVSGFSQPIWRSMQRCGKVLMKVNATETWWNIGDKKL